jgi:hypothetical protein
MKYGVALDSRMAQPPFHDSGSIGSFDGLDSAGEQSEHIVIFAKPFDTVDAFGKKGLRCADDVCLVCS